MPKHRKSACLWQECDVCHSIIRSKEVEAHEVHCPSSDVDWVIPFLRRNVLYSFLEEINPEDISGLAEELHEGLVLLSQSAMQLCGFIIGHPVVVFINGIPSVRKAWPIVSGSLTQVKLWKQDIQLNWGIDQISKPIKVFQLKSPVPFAKTVTYKIIQPLDEQILPETLKNVLPYKFKDKVLFLRDKIRLKLYGKTIELEIVDRQLKTDISSIEEEMEAMTFAEEPFRVFHMTGWEMFTEDLDDAPKEKCCVGGYSDILKQLQEMRDLSLKPCFQEMHSAQGVLLYGIHGIGKTLISQHLAYNSNAAVINIQSTDIFSKFYGESEKKLRGSFSEAILKSPSIIILDNVEALCPKKGTDLERRVSSTLLSMFDEIQGKPIFVIGTSSRPDDIEPSLRRPGRLETELEIPIPSPEDRFLILRSLIDMPSLESTLKQVAFTCHGFVGADLAALWKKASSHAVMSGRTYLEPGDLISAIPLVKPSAMREVYVQVPNVKWEDIGGQESLKQQLQQAVEWPLKYPDSFKRLGITPPRGVLMFGPPGCSKTMAAKAVATESKINFLSVKGSDIFSKWVGESERAVRDLFKRARSVSPAIIFIDEIDALGGEREAGASSGGSAVQERVLSQLLTEMDGVQPLRDVVIIAATNRPDRIDKALLRPGRLDRLIYVPLPSSKARFQIFGLNFSKMPISEDVSIDELTNCTEGYSGAEIVAVCNEAALKALEENIDAGIVSRKHFLDALIKVTPRTPPEALDLYAAYINKNLT